MIKGAEEQFFKLHMKRADEAIFKKLLKLLLGKKVQDLLLQFHCPSSPVYLTTHYHQSTADHTLPKGALL